MPGANTAGPSRLPRAWCTGRQTPLPTRSSPPPAVVDEEEGSRDSATATAAPRFRRAWRRQAA